MANTIELAKSYVPLLDEVYKNAALTSDLDGASELAQAGANANELIIPMIEMDGLANYDRNSGYINGDVTIKNQTVACNYDRGRKFTVDSMDNIETAGIAFGRLAGEFIRTKEVPELDAFRFSTYSGIKGISSAYGSLSTGDSIIKALRTATAKMDDDEVPTDNRILYIRSDLYGVIDDMDTTKSRKVLERFSKIVPVPSSRFMTNITLNDGKTSGQEKGGYAKSAKSVDINFEIIHKSAVIQYTKHKVPKIIDPNANPDADAWTFGYRNVGIAKVYQNKVAGIYCHTATQNTATQSLEDEVKSVSE